MTDDLTPKGRSTAPHPIEPKGAACFILQREAEARCKAEFLPQLVHSGITRIDFRYDSTTDSTETWSMTVRSGDVEACLPDVPCYHYYLDDHGDVMAVAMHLGEALHAFARSVVRVRHADWMSGLGAWGFITLDVVSGMLDITHVKAVLPLKHTPRQSES